MEHTVRKARKEHGQGARRSIIHHPTTANTQHPTANTDPFLRSTEFICIASMPGLISFLIRTSTANFLSLENPKTNIFVMSTANPEEDNSFCIRLETRTVCKPGPSYFFCLLSIENPETYIFVMSTGNPDQDNSFRICWETRSVGKPGHTCFFNLLVNIIPRRINIMPRSGIKYRASLFISPRSRNIFLRRAELIYSEKLEYNTPRSRNIFS